MNGSHFQLPMAWQVVCYNGAMSQDVVVRHCFQFRLRTLMIGVTLFCITVGGYVGWQAKIVRQRLAELNRHRNATQSNDVADEFHAVPWIRRSWR